MGEMDTCGTLIGVILATPSDFVIHFVQVRDVPVMTIESFLEYLGIWIGVEIDREAAQSLTIGRPRCTVPPVDTGGR